MKILPVRAELFHAEGRTDMTKLIVAVRHFAKEPKKFIQVTDTMPSNNKIAHRNFFAPQKRN